MNRYQVKLTTFAAHDHGSCRAITPIIQAPSPQAALNVLVYRLVAARQAGQIIAWFTPSVSSFKIV